MTLVAVQAAALGIGLLVLEPRRTPLGYAGLVVLASAPWIWLLRGLSAGRLRVPVAWVLAAGLVLRLLACLAPPAVLSDDIHRYVWEGRVQVAGHNPFLDAPQSLAELGGDDPSWRAMNNREIPAAYPPVGQLFLRLVAWTGGGVPVFRAGFAACDVLVMFLLAAFLARIGRDPALAAAHALCPLAVVEMCVEGHNDALGIALLVAAFMVLGKGRASRGAALLSGALLGAAISAKFLPAVLLPWFARRDARVLPACAVVFAASYLPFWPEGGSALDLFQGLQEYGARWRSNDSLFAPLIAATEWVIDATPALAGIEPQRLSKLPLGVLFLAGCVLLFRRYADPASAFVGVLTLLFALTPTLHPWYVVWVVPFLAVRAAAAPVLLVTTVSLSYHVLTGWHHPPAGVAPRWEESWLVKAVEYAPFYGAIAYCAWSRKTSSNRRITAAGENSSE